jgi:hypothetical protein
MKIIKKYKHSLIIFEALQSIFIIGILIFIIILLRDDFESFNIQNLKYIWSRSPIQDIISLDMNVECPPEYENMININYPGISQGCQCKQINVSDTKHSMCSFEQIYLGCKNIYSKSSRFTKNYKNKTLCMKNIGENYMTLRKNAFKNKNCPNDTIKCGIFDSFGNQLCMPENSCPINDIIFTNSNSSAFDGYNKLILKELQYNDIYTDTYLFFTNKNNEKIITNFILQGEERTVCSNEHFRSYDIFKDCLFNDYPENYKTCNNIWHDSIYGSSIDAINGGQFYSNNDIISNYYHKIESCSNYNEFRKKLLFTSNYHGMSENVPIDISDGFINIILSRQSVRANLVSYLGIIKFALIFVYFLFALFIKFYLLNAFNFKKIKLVYIIEIFTSIFIFIIGLYLLSEYFLLKNELNYIEYFIKNKSQADDYINNIAMELYSYDILTIVYLQRAFIFIFLGSFVYPIKLIYLSLAFKKTKKSNDTIYSGLYLDENFNHNIFEKNSNIKSSN